MGSKKEKLVINDTRDYFIKVIQPRLDRAKIQNPFNDYEFQHLSYYNKKVWSVLDIDVKNTDESVRVARARAFSLAKQKIYFNQDMQYFVTFTYAKNMTDYNKLKTDIKLFFQSEKRYSKIKPKYIWVVEKQHRGALHVHMLCNNFFTTHKNKNGRDSLSYWPHGFTSIYHVSDFDDNFKPFLYLFKYMNKSVKIGGRYVHASKNLNNFDVLTDFKFNKSDKTKVFSERSVMGTLDRYITKAYYSSNKLNERG